MPFTNSLVLTMRLTNLPPASLSRSRVPHRMGLPPFVTQKKTFTAPTNKPKLGLKALFTKAGQLAVLGLATTGLHFGTASKAMAQTDLIPVPPPPATETWGWDSNNNDSSGRTRHNDRYDQDGWGWGDEGSNGSSNYPSNERIKACLHPTTLEVKRDYPGASQESIDRAAQAYFEDKQDCLTNGPDGNGSRVNLTKPDFQQILQMYNEAEQLGRERIQERLNKEFENGVNNNNGNLIPYNNNY
jgi:hypothetical protein